MSFSWNCGPEDFVGMGATFRIGIGLPKPKGRESWTDVAVRAIKEGKGPLIARYVFTLIRQNAGTILDFGCGAAALQVRALDALGYDIVGYEWPPDKNDTSRRAEFYWEAVEDGMIDPKALKRKYDIVLASNVMNVQPTWGCFWTTINTLWSTMRRDGVYICNLASEPRRIWSKGRKGDLQLEALLQLFFDNDNIRREKSVPTSTGRPTSDWVWVCPWSPGMNDTTERTITLDLLEGGILAHRGGL